MADAEDLFAGQKDPPNSNGVPPQFFVGIALRNPHHFTELSGTDLFGNAVGQIYSAQPIKRSRTVAINGLREHVHSIALAGAIDERNVCKWVVSRLAGDDPIADIARRGAVIPCAEVIYIAAR